MTMQPTRRRFIAGSLLLPLTQTVARADNEPPAQPPSEEVAALLRRRDELLEQQRQLDEQWKIANARLPDWCKPGPKYRDIKGKEFGERVGWPPLSEPILLESARLLIRASPYDLRRLFEDDAQRIGRIKASERYLASIADLRRKQCERRCIERMVWLPRTVDWLLIDKEIEEIEDAVALASTFPAR